MKWHFPIFSYFWLVLCVTRVSCFLLLITLPLNIFDMLTEKSSCHLHDTCYCLFPSPPSLHCSPCPEGTAISCYRWCQDDQAVSVVLPAWEGCLSSLPGLPALREKGLRDGKYCLFSGPFNFYSQSPHPPSTGLRCQALAGDNLTDSPKPLPSSDQSFISGSTSRLDDLSVRTNPRQRSPRTMSEGQPGMPSPQIRTS